MGGHHKVPILGWWVGGLRFFYCPRRPRSYQALIQRYVVRYREQIRRKRGLYLSKRSNK
ncbi:MAG: hypothetical protein ACPGWR_19305 [Ardenticatenaceae bacterium]